MEPTDSSIGNELLRLTLKCRDIDRRLAVRTGLTIDEMHCLHIVECERPSCVKILSELLDINATRTSKLITSLERKGYLVRSLDVSDHRKEQVTLTGEGKRLVEMIQMLYAEHGVKLLGSLPLTLAGKTEAEIHNTSVS